jgi:hypothetical protein
MKIATPPTSTGNPGQPRDLQFRGPFLEMFFDGAVVTVELFPRPEQAAEKLWIRGEIGGKHTSGASSPEVYVPERSHGFENPLLGLKSGAFTDQAVACYKYGAENIQTPDPGLTSPAVLSRRPFGTAPCSR